MRELIATLTRRQRNRKKSSDKRDDGVLERYTLAQNIPHLEKLYLSVLHYSVSKIEQYNLLIPVISPQQKKILLALLAGWIVSLSSFWIWWLQTSHVVTWTGMIINSLILVFDTIMPGYLFFFACKMKRPNPNLPIPVDWKVAMVTTKTPTEPWSVVKKTLTAMLAQTYPHDTWLADEDPSPETIAWCRTHGVSISCRKGIKEYHCTTWPRRTQCKEGNLAYFYDTVGYANYNIVVQLDADHVPSVGYLEAMIRPFVNQKVGYVAAPSVCDANPCESWMVNGRLFAEASVHGILQAGYSDGWAPLCIGSHYAVRTTALKQIGGLGPELAEDHTTTLMMNAHGWQGVFAFDAEAHGYGPACVTDGLVQEFQWSRSLTKVLLSITPTYWHRLKPHLKFQFLFAQLWYLVFGISFLIEFLLPIVAILNNQPWVRVSYLEFMARHLVLTLVTIVPVVWLRHCKCLRPQNAKVLSWEEILFQIARGSWILAGVSHGILSVLTQRELNFKITPKGDRNNKLLPFKVIVPYFILGLASAIAVVIFDQISRYWGYYFLSLVNAAIYLGLCVAIIWLHIYENAILNRWRYLSYQVMVIAALLVFVVAADSQKQSFLARVQQSLTCLQVSLINITPSYLWHTNAQTPDTSHPILSSSQIALGVYDPSESFANQSGVQIEHYFVPWRLDNAKELTAALKDAKQAERFPLITLEPWPWEWNNMVSDTLLEDIVAGKYDPTLIRIFQAIKSEAPHPVLLRFAHEMEILELYPWSQKDEKSYIAAYQYVVNYARKLGVNNIYWVWSPAGNIEAMNYYPGEEYVDYVGVTILATQEWNADQGIPSFKQLMSKKYWLTNFTGKPMIVAEVGINGTDEEKTQWLEETVKSLSNFPNLQAFIYYNQEQPQHITPLDFEADWSLNHHQVETLLRKYL